MNFILQLRIEPKPSKKKEFSQTITKLSEALEELCSNLKFDESDEEIRINLLFTFESMNHMQVLIDSEEFAILSGAVTALCELIEIRLNDKLVVNRSSMLADLKKQTSNT